MLFPLRLDHLRWLALATFVGLTFALTTVLWAPDVRIARGRSLSPDEFAAQAFGTVGLDRLPALRNLIVYPPATTHEGGQLQYVTGEVCVRLPGRPPIYEPFTFYADLPFTGTNAAPSASYSVVDFLSNGSGAHRSASFQYAWWASTPVIFALWIGGSVLMATAIIPNLIKLLRTLMAGIRSGTRSSHPSPKSPVPEAGMIETAGIPDAGEQESAPGPSRRAQAEEAQSAGVKSLVIPEETAPHNARPEEPHHYVGEFYPVDLPVTPKEHKSI